MTNLPIAPRLREVADILDQRQVGGDQAIARLIREAADLLAPVRDVARLREAPTKCSECGHANPHGAPSELVGVHDTCEYDGCFCSYYTPAAPSVSGGRGAATQGPAWTCRCGDVFPSSELFQEHWRMVHENEGAADAEAGRREAPTDAMLLEAVDAHNKAMLDYMNTHLGRDYDSAEMERICAEAMRAILTAALAGAPHGDGQAGTKAEETPHATRPVATALTALDAAERAIDLGPHPDCSCKATGKPCPCRWSLDPKRIALDRAARINAADAADETLKKGLKLIEALLEPCETPNGAVDHAWRQCRRCLAAAELDAHNRDDYAPLLRAVLSAAVSAAPVRDVARLRGEPTPEASVAPHIAVIAASAVGARLYRNGRPKADCDTIERVVREVLEGAKVQCPSCASSQPWPDKLSRWWVCRRCHTAYHSPTTGRPPVSCRCLKSNALLVVAADAEAGRRVPQAARPVATTLTSVAENLEAVVAENRHILDSGLDTEERRCYLRGRIDAYEFAIRRVREASAAVPVSPQEEP